MADPDPTDLTQLLQRLGQGDEGAHEALLPLVYERLRGVAARVFQGERPGHTLQPTALVHDAWIQLVNEDHAAWQNRAQFFAVGATLMRRILVDHARARQSLKRGGAAERISVHEGLATEFENGADLLDLDRALGKLARLDDRQHRIVELRFFSGLKVNEVADCMGVSVRTIEAEWTMAKAWLRRELERDTGR